MKITHSGIAVSYTLRVQQWLGSLKEEEASAGVTARAFFPSSFEVGLLKPFEELRNESRSTCRAAVGSAIHTCQAG